MEKEMKWIKISGIVSLALIVLHNLWFGLFNQEDVLFFSLFLLAILLFVGSIAYTLILHFKKLVKTKK